MSRFFTLSLLALALTLPTLAENWPQWRGPLGNGVSPETGLPLRWSASENVAWKTPLKGRGVSSPVVWGDTIFLSSQKGRGAIRPGNHPTLSRGSESMEKGLDVSDPSSGDGGVTFLIQAFDTANGSLKWEIEVPSRGDLPEVHSKHNLASPSCATDGTAVFCLFATGQLVAAGVDGGKLWEKSLGPFDINWGHSSSPYLYRDTLYVLCDHRNQSYLAALDKKSGEQKWKQDRSSSRGAYSTPMVMPGPEGDELIVNSSEGIEAYNPSSGELLWFYREPNRFPVPSPSYGDGVIYTSRGYRSSPYLAIQPGGRGDITESHVKWHVATGAPYVSSVVYYQGIVFFVNDSGIVTAAAGEDGETLWKQRVGGVFSASPVAGDGKVYLTNEGGEVIVLKASGEGEVLARNSLGERCLASPAISNGRLFFRTDKHLIAIGE